MSKYNINFSYAQWFLNVFSSHCPLPAGKEFPNSFESLVKKICRYLFHVLAHIYWAHFKETVALDLHGHLNTLYAHFIVFVREFNLVDPKETCIMDDLSEVLCTPLPSSPQQNHVTERWATLTEPRRVRKRRMNWECVPSGGPGLLAELAHPWTI